MTVGAFDFTLQPKTNHSLNQEESKMKSNQSTASAYYQFILDLIQLESQFKTNDELNHYYQSNFIPMGF